jgi:hypothetical protein
MYLIQQRAPVVWEMSALHFVDMALSSATDALLVLPQHHTLPSDKFSFAVRAARRIRCSEHVRDATRTALCAVLSNKTKKNKNNKNNAESNDNNDNDNAKNKGNNNDNNDSAKKNNKNNCNNGNNNTLFELELQFRSGYDTLTAEAARLLSSALPSLTALTQLKISLACDTPEASNVIANIAQLPLTALSINLCLSNDEHAVLLCETLKTLAKQLEVVELRCDADGFAEVLWTTLDCAQFSGLRVLRVLGSAVPTLRARTLSSILSRLTLENLALQVSDAESLKIVTEYFNMGHGTQLHTLGIAVETAKPIDLLWFFKSLANARVSRIHLLETFYHENYFEPLLDSSLFVDGWICEIEFPLLKTPEPLPSQIRALLLRNQERHKVCCATSLCLIWIRKSKRALSMVAFELVKWIAMLLFETRNKDCWDYLKTGGP